MLNLSEQALFRQIIMEHYARPLHKGLVRKNSIIIAQESDSCIDNLELEIITNNNIIIDSRFEGIGCAISCAASDILAEEIIGKDFLIASNIINNYLAMLLSKEYQLSLLNDLVAFKNVPQQPNRIRCASLGAYGFLAAVTEAQNK